MNAHCPICRHPASRPVKRRQFWQRLAVAAALTPLLAFVAGCTPARQTPAPEPRSAPPPIASAAPRDIAPQVETLPSLDSDIKLRPPSGARDTIVVGFVAPFSGPNGALGQAMLNAAQMALFDLGAPPETPGGAEISLAPRDSGGTAEGARRAVQDAIEAGARLIIGPLFSAEVEAVAPLARSRNIPIVAFTNDYAVAGEGVYIIGFTPESQIARVVQHAASRGATRFAALVPESVYGTRITAALQSAARAQNVAVTRVETYDSAATTQDVAPVVRRLANYNQRHATLLAQRRDLAARNDEASRAALRRLQGVETLGEVDFDAVLIAESGERLKIIAPLLLFHDIDPRRVRALGMVEWDTPETWTEPALVGGWYPAAPDATHAAFRASYRQAFGQVPPPRAALGYDATALAVVLARGGGDAFSRQALTAPNGFAGIDGIFRLTPAGVVERGMAVKEIGTRTSRTVSPAPTTFENLNN